MKTILDLLHQNKDSLLKDRKSKMGILFLMLCIYNECIDALTQFYNDELSFFDAQVGETSCQIRAYRVLTLSKVNNDVFNKSIIKDTKFRLVTSRAGLVNFLDSMKELVNQKMNSYDKSLDKPIQLCKFFDQMDVLVEFNNDIIFIIQCYFLTKFSLRDKDDIPIAINYRKLCCDFNITHTQAKLLIHKSQREVAECSCDFIFELAEQVLLEESNLKTALPFLKHIAEEQRFVLPSYYSSKIILLHSLKTFQPILLTSKRYIQENYVDTIQLLFVPNNLKIFIFNENCLSFPINTSCVVIRGEVEYDDFSSIESEIDYKNRIIQLGIEKIVLYNMAVHPQYTGARLENLADNPFLVFTDHNTAVFSDNNLIKFKELENELLNDKASAVYHGCCITNKSLFLLKHVFCDLIKNQLHLIDAMPSLVKETAIY